MPGKITTAAPPGEIEAACGKTDLLGANAEECLRLARTSRDRGIRDELLRLAQAYRERARAADDCGVNP